ncbi:MAG: terminase small subunit [Candidatus Thalassarchaeaceae archaeon]
MGNSLAARDMALAAEKLTPKQRALVDNLFLPGTTQEEAAINAGYAQTSAKVTASRTLRLPHVQEYINACVQEGIQSNSIRALGVVAELSDTANSDYVRLQAAQDILDRAGHKPVEKSAVAVRGELSVNIDLS